MGRKKYETEEERQAARREVVLRSNTKRRTGRPVGQPAKYKTIEEKQAAARMYSQRRADKIRKPPRQRLTCLRCGYSWLRHRQAVGRRPNCQKCQSKKWDIPPDKPKPNRTFYKSDDERRAANKAHCAKYYAAHKSRMNAQATEWRQLHPEESKQIAKRWRETNHDKRIAYWNKNKEWLKARQKERDAANRDQVNKRIKKWTLANPDKVKAANHRRRTNMIGEYTDSDWVELLDLCGHKCLRCGISEEQSIYRRLKSGPIRGKLTIDHIVPASKNGTTYIYNLQPLCMPCQNWKQTRTIDFRPRIARMRFCEPVKALAVENAA